MVASRALDTLAARREGSSPSIRTMSKITYLVASMLTALLLVSFIHPPTIQKLVNKCTENPMHIVYLAASLYAGYWLATWLGYKLFRKHPWDK